ncbi:MAG TPA: hypothetical protein VNA57_02675 [Acidimicrobiales bacterium]|nr:hypothetical protein [Acidimicrobiales bacterium]
MMLDIAIRVNLAVGAITLVLALTLLLSEFRTGSTSRGPERVIVIATHDDRVLALGTQTVDLGHRKADPDPPSPGGR